MSGSGSGKNSNEGERARTQAAEGPRKGKMNHLGHLDSDLAMFIVGK